MRCACVIALILSVTRLQALLIEDAAHIFDTLSVRQITVSDSHRFAWYRISKVCTQTISVVLRDQAVSTKNYTILNPKHKLYFKFAFVRNPWDRVVSVYCSKVLNCSYYPFRECFGMDFEHFVGFICQQDINRADRHIRQQTNIIPFYDMDFIGRFENFDEDIRIVLERIGIPFHELPKINASRHKHYSHYYTERTKEMIAQKYKDDVEVFGYEFENEPFSLLLND